MVNSGDAPWPGDRHAPGTGGQPGMGGGVMTKHVEKVVRLSDKRREVRGRITETGEIIRFDAIREGKPDDEGPRAA